jgi:hypothetical protein
MNNNNQKEEHPLILKLKELYSRRFDLVMALDFYVIFPNGKRVPVDEVCSTMAADPKCRPLRMFEDRLVLVVEAILPIHKFPYEGDWNLIAPVAVSKTERLYWRQAFYLSTGTSSQMPRTWLPFDGIVLGDEGAERVLSWGKFYQLPFSDLFGKPYVQEIWVNKRSFVDYKVPRSQNNLLNKLFSTYQLTLPEGMERKERYGPLSFILASSKLGGDDMINMATEITARGFLDEGNAESYIAAFQTPHLLEPCFENLAETLPISKAYAVNAYIDKFQANWYHNRIPGIQTPLLKDISAPIQPLNISLPIFIVKSELSSSIQIYHKDFLMGIKSVEEIQAALDAQPYSKFDKKNILKNTKEFRITDKMLANERFKNFLGGKKKTLKKRYRNRKVTRRH